jgi:murein L,D-transpeptidase YafK
MINISLFHKSAVVQLFFLMSLIFIYGFNEKNKIREIERKKRKENKLIGTGRIVIDKSDYLLRVYDDEGLFARYPVVFGSEPDRDKFKQGDKRTPEGVFTIQYVQKHKKWHLMMMLDYPNAMSIEKFERRKKEGKIDPGASIGSAIAIHGTWPHDDYLIDKYKNWTDGCISLKNSHIDDLKLYIKAGAKVEIQK